MEICIKSGLYGASKAKGTSVIIDVLRASSTICAILAGGARCIFPTKFLKEARKLKKDNPDYLLIGERHGLKPGGFDFGNSPYDVSQMYLRDRFVIFTSSAGSRAILKAQKACVDELLIGSFVNASSIASYIRNKQPVEVSLISVGAIGLGPYRKAVEDQLCAQYIEGLLKKEQLDFSRIRREIQVSDGAKRLRKLGQSKDLEMCLKLDIYNGIIPRTIVNGDFTKIVNLTSD